MALTSWASIPSRPRSNEPPFLAKDQIKAPDSVDLVGPEKFSLARKGSCTRIHSLCVGPVDRSIYLSHGCLLFSEKVGDGNKSSQQNQNHVEKWVLQLNPILTANFRLDSSIPFLGAVWRNYFSLLRHSPEFSSPILTDPASHRLHANPIANTQLCRSFSTAPVSIRNR